MGAEADGVRRQGDTTAPLSHGEAAPARTVSGREYARSLRSLRMGEFSGLQKRASKTSP
jgi:hypothetical protein